MSRLGNKENTIKKMINGDHKSSFLKKEKILVVRWLDSVDPVNVSDVESC